MVDITATYLRSILHYDHRTGIFTWRERPREHFKTCRACSVWNIRFAGKITGCIGGAGYLYICIDYKLYRAHRLAWIYVTGEWPSAEIDHIDGNPSNNRFSNLREATHAENGRNVGILANNASGVKGVSWDGRRNKWRARIMVDRKEFYLGYFDDIEDAAAAYKRAAIELHGEFARVAC